MKKTIIISSLVVAAGLTAGILLNQPQETKEETPVVNVQKENSPVSAPEAPQEPEVVETNASPSIVDKPAVEPDNSTVEESSYTNPNVDYENALKSPTIYCINYLRQNYQKYSGENEYKLALSSIPYAFNNTTSVEDKRVVLTAVTLAIDEKNPVLFNPELITEYAKQALLTH